MAASRHLPEYFDEPVAVSFDPIGEPRISRYGDRVGRLSPVQQVGLDRSDPLDCGLSLATATVAVANLKVEAAQRSVAWAAANAAELAAAKAISEGYERWAIGDIRPAPAKCRARALDDPIIVPDDLLRYPSSYYTTHADILRPYDDTQERHWVAVSRADGRRRYVLAEFVFNPFWGAGPDRRVHAFSSSSGVATHPHEPQAARNAVRELIERDAIMAWWTGAIEVTEIDRSSPVLDRQMAAAPGVHTRGPRFFAIRTRHGMAVLAALRSRLGGIVIGARSSPRLAVAAAGALVEAIVSMTAVDAQAVRAPRELQDIVHPFDHALWYSLPGPARAVDRRLPNRRPTCVDHDMAAAIERTSAAAEESTFASSYFYRYQVWPGSDRHTVRALNPALEIVPFGHRNTPQLKHGGLLLAPQPLG